MESSKKEEKKPSESQQSAEQTPQQKIALLQKTLKQYNKFFQNYLKSSFMCTISHDLMSDPVIISSGQTFERSSICDSIRLRGLVCPNTRLPLRKQQAKPENLIPNVSIRGLIKEYKEFLERTDPQKLRQLLNVTQNSRITISEYQKANAKLDIDPVKKILRHSYKKVDMGMFLKCDWRQIMQMDLTQCEVDDKGIQLMLQKADKLFPKLIQIDLRCNLIHEIKNLQRFKKLRRINLQHNPLSKQTIKYLKNIANTKLRIKL